MNTLITTLLNNFSVWLGTGNVSFSEVCNVHSLYLILGNNAYGPLLCHLKIKKCKWLFPEILLVLCFEIHFWSFNCSCKFAYVFTLDHYFTGCWILIQKKQRAHYNNFLREPLICSMVTCFTISFSLAFG